MAMAPKSFSEDGAFGGSSPGQQQDWAGSGSSSSSDPFAAYSGDSSLSYGGVSNSSMSPWGSDLQPGQVTKGPNGQIYGNMSNGPGAVDPGNGAGGFRLDASPWNPSTDPFITHSGGMGFAEGGAIPEDDSDTGTPMQPAEDDATGVNEQVASQSQPQQPQQGQQSPGSDGGPLNPVPAAKKIIAYLMGAGAAHPQSIDQVGQQVDPEGKMPPSDRNVLAIDKVRETHGDNAAWSLMQANRVAYNAKAAFAKTALDGTPQKPADLNAAVDAANQAQTHVLDGSNVLFQPAQGGVTATVKLPGNSEPQQIALSPQAFKSFLDVGGDGQWDKVVDHSAPATLERLAKQYPIQQGQPQQGSPQQGQPQPGAQPRPPVRNPVPAPNQPVFSRGPTTFGKTPSTLNLSGSDERGEDIKAPNTDISPEIEARARQLYPSASQSAERNKYIAGEVTNEASNENKIDVQNAKGDFGLKIAGVKTEGAKAVGAGHDTAKVQSSQNFSQARIEAAKQKLQSAALHEEAVNGRNAITQSMRGLVAKVNAGQKLNPNEQGIWDRVVQHTPDPSAAAPQQAQPQQQNNSFPAAPPDPAQRKVGQVYSSPTGKRGKWMGNGWQAVQ
jgi:hypothetical protein